MASLFHYLKRAPSKLRKLYFAERAERLHIGSGEVRISGWTNIDNRRLPGVDRVVDVTYGLPFRDVRFIFAEHFVEHLHYGDAMYFLRECRRVLRDDGVLRLSTPNLEWVLATHYGNARVEDCFRINRAFRGWGHQFLYNFEVLEATLQDAGFASIVRREYGQSTIAELQNLERHERNEDLAGVSHILIVEASGRGGARRELALETSRDWYLRDTGVR
jgi:predicted SAM-dependent methyltransferase